MVADVDGTIVECGVARGESLLMLTLLANAEGKGREVWAFDSFEGFPEPSVHDVSPRRVQKGERAVDVESVCKLLRDGGVPQAFMTTKVTLVKGFFEETLADYRGGRIALLHLDVDLYESYRCALRQLQPEVAPGGVTAFDEYLGTFDRINWPGARKAIDEYFGKDISRITKDTSSGKYYLVKPPA